MLHDALRPESIVVASGRPERSTHAPVNAPIVLSATFHHGAGDNPYVREVGTPAVHAFEAVLGELEGGTALAFASGMAAIAAVVEGRPAGSVVVVPDACYGGTVGIFARQQELGRLTVRSVDVADTEAVLRALPGAQLLWLESPTNPLMGVVDLPVLADAAHVEGALVCVDSTFNTPLVLRPLAYGADLVMHSATKFLSGHSDVLMGALVVRSPQLAAELHVRRTLTGGVAGALEAYLGLRGLRTLAVRMERAQANAGELAARLAAHPAVQRVRYPGLPADPFHERATRLHNGYGALLSFDVAGTEEDAERVCQRVQLITHATSLGGVESLMERRARYAVDAACGTPPNLVRLSVGIEHVEDLWADLAAALG
jgi:cystathionine gamma-synthase